MRLHCIILVILISGLFSVDVSAINSIPATRADEINLSESSSLIEIKRPKKMGFIKKWLIKRIVKKIKKKAKKDPEFYASQKKLAGISLAAGLSSFVLLFAGLVNPLIWILAALLAIVGDVLSIKVLHETKDDKEAYKKTRGTAKAGLVFSLLTGLLPLALLVIFLATV